MATEPYYCLLNSSACFTIDEWNKIIGNISYLFTIAIAGFTIFQYFRKEKIEKKSGSIKYSIEQHRRLFDDPDLFEILNLIDDDSTALAKQNMGGKKRKFITFIEEMVFLVRAGIISEDYAVYMFGYYAHQARNGKNFMKNMSDLHEDWGVFFDFADMYPERIGKINTETINL